MNKRQNTADMGILGRGSHLEQETNCTWSRYYAFKVFFFWSPSDISVDVFYAHFWFWVKLNALIIFNLQLCSACELLNCTYHLSLRTPANASARGGELMFSVGFVLFNNWKLHFQANFGVFWVFPGQTHCIGCTSWVTKLRTPGNTWAMEAYVYLVWEPFIESPSLH